MIFSSVAFEAGIFSTIRPPRVPQHVNYLNVATGHHARSRRGQSVRCPNREGERQSAGLCGDSQFIDAKPAEAGAEAGCATGRRRTGVELAALPWSKARHVRVIEALRKRDGERSRKAISQDILIGGKTLLEKLKA